MITGFLFLASLVFAVMSGSMMFASGGHHARNKAKDAKGCSAWGLALLVMTIAAAFFSGRATL